jgi:TorA maturation chaperone TorD
VTVAAPELQTLAQADLLLLLSRHLLEPTQANRDYLRVGAEDLRELLEAAGAPHLLEPWERLQRAMAELDPETWLHEHTRLFEARQLCPATETAYIRRDKGALLPDIAGFYAAFGLTPDQDSGEKLDHLTAELEFVAMLLVMAVRAQGLAQTEDAEVTLAALRSFSDDHLGEWLPGFCARLGDVTTQPLYRHLAELLLGTWRVLREAHDLPCSERKVLLTVEEDPGTPYECGMADAGLA